MDIVTLAAMLSECRFSECRAGAGELLVRSEDLTERDRAFAYLALSQSLSALHSIQEAIGPAELAVHYAESAGDYDLVGDGLCNLAKVYHESGLSNRAVACLTDYFHRFGLYVHAREREGWVLSQMARCYQAMGRGPKALDYGRRAYRWHLESGASPHAIEEQRGQLIWLHLKLGQLEPASQLLRASQDYLRQSPNDLHARGSHLNNVAYHAFLTGAYGSALDTAVQVLQIRNVSHVQKALACLTLHSTARAMGLSRVAMGLGTLARIQANVARRPDLEHEATRSMLHMQQDEGLPLMDELLRTLRQHAETTAKV